MHCCAKLCKVMSVCSEFLTYFAYIAYLINIAYFAYCLYFYIFQRGLMTETKSTTGMFQIKGQVTVYPSEQTAGTKVRPLQNPSSQAAILLALASTFGIEPRFDASLHTLWLEVAVTTWVTML